MKNKLSYFKMIDNGSAYQDSHIIIFNREHKTVFQAWLAASSLSFDLMFYAPREEGMFDDIVVLSHSSVSNFKKAFRSVLPFMEKLPDFNADDFDDVKSCEDFTERLKKECDEIEAHSIVSDLSTCDDAIGTPDTFLTIMKVPEPTGKKGSYVLAYDSRDFKDLEEAQYVAERLAMNNADLEEEKQKFCKLTTLDAFEQVFEGIEWVRGNHEVQTAYRQAVLQNRADLKKGNTSYAYLNDNEFCRMVIGYIDPKKPSNKIICHTGNKDVQLRVHPSYSNPEDFKDKTYIWNMKDYRPTNNGKKVFLCVAIRKLCDGNHISYACAILDSKTVHHHDTSDKKYLRTLKRLCEHSGGLSRDELAKDFYSYYIKAEQLEQWGATPYTVNIRNAVITPVKFSEKKGKYVPCNLKEGNYDTLHFIAEDELEETNLLTLTPDNLDEMKPLLEILLDRYTIQSVEVRKNQKLRVTVL